MDFNSGRRFGPSPSFSNDFFNHEASQAGYFNPYFVGGDLIDRDPNEALRWEHEKQRIRAEMIEANMARRRQIEEEVRREISIEREIALRRARLLPESSTPTKDEILFPNSAIPQVRTEGRFSLDSRPSYSIDHVRYVSADSDKTQKSPAVFPTKLSSSTAAGIMRNTALPHIAGCAAEEARKELSWLAIPRKKQKMTQSSWICDICSVSCTSSDAMAGHLHGKKHMKKVSVSKAYLGEGASRQEGPEAFETNVSDSTGVPSSNAGAGKSKFLEKELSDPSNNTAGVKTTFPQKKSSRKRKNKANPDAIGLTQVKSQSNATKFAFWCELCRVHCNSISVRDKHLEGKKHFWLSRRVKRDVKNAGAIQSVKVEAKATGESDAEYIALVPKGG